jgi:hypothetical protein
VTAWETARATEVEAIGTSRRRVYRPAINAWINEVRERESFVMKGLLREWMQVSIQESVVGRLYFAAAARR